MRTEASPYYNVAYTNWYHGGNAPAAPPGKPKSKAVPNPKAPAKAKPAAPQPPDTQPEPDDDDGVGGEPAAPKAASAAPGSLAALLSVIPDA